MQKCTEAEQISGGRVLLFHLLKGERPGSSHRFGIVSNEAATFVEHLNSPRAIEALIVRETTSRFFDVCSSLIQCEWESSQFLTDLSCRGNIRSGGILQGSFGGDKRS